MNWAIELDDRTDYVEGSKAETAEEAEKVWRQTTGIHFLKVVVRRTTPDEDARLNISIKKE